MKREMKTALGFISAVFAVFMFIDLVVNGAESNTSMLILSFATTFCLVFSTLMFMQIYEVLYKDHCTKCGKMTNISELDKNLMLFKEDVCDDCLIEF